MTSSLHVKSIDMIIVITFGQKKMEVDLSLARCWQVPNYTMMQDI